MPHLRCVPLRPDLWDDWVTYFEHRPASGCWCMNHRLPVGLDFEGEAAKLAMEQLVRSGRVFGVLAYSGDDPIPVGWAALDRRQTLPGHDCIGTEIDCPSSVWSLHCVTSRSDRRDQGVERALTEAAVALASAWNGTRLEAYPEPDSTENTDFMTWNTFGGYADVFAELGFTVEGAASEFFSPMVKQLL